MKIGVVGSRNLPRACRSVKDKKPPSRMRLREGGLVRDYGAGVKRNV